ncbi:MAG: transglutaminase family protein [Pseudomonadota bacterium]
MSLALSASFAFDLDRAADALLQFEAAALPQQRIIEARARIAGSETINRVAAQDDIGERIWIHAQGRVEVRYEALVEVERALTPLETLVALPPHLLPGAAVKYLFDSRYCPSSQFIAFLEERFANTGANAATNHPTKGGARIAAIRDWVAGHIAYTPGASGPETSATDTFHQRAGICRDFAHLFVTLARASAIPARYVACYAPGVTPQDFHAVAEVFLADPESPTIGSWRLVDATGMADLTRAAIIGVGRDAGDVSFLTSFGPMRFASSAVAVERAESPACGAHSPAPIAVEA